MSCEPGGLVESTDHVTFTEAEITRQALVHSSALTYLMVAYAKECGRSPEDAAEFSGRIFAKGWARFAGEGAQAVARHIALILVCIGGEIETITGDDMRAEVRASGVVTHEDAHFFGLTRDEVDGFCNVFAPMTAEIGFSFSWRRDGDDLVYAITAR